ncbi:MAG: SPASM domain-containing protein [Verrucomicrobia bacterium]|nr:SPASM domain-containing protein [Verrucomicrobiota bacterium]
MSIPPFQEIHIENTNSCGYKCVMCPREKQTRQIGFMSLEDFSLLLSRVEGFQGKFHLHGFGESLLDRQFVSKIEILKKRFPLANTLIFSTLGVRVKEDYFIKLLKAGLDSLVISLYGFTEEDYQKVHGYNGFDLVKKNLQLLSQAMKISSSPFRAQIKIPGQTISSSLPIRQPPEKIAFCRWAEELGFTIAEWAYVHNYSDGRHYNLPNSEKTCPVINGKRKNILSVTWDLNVIPCTYDFNASIRFGNLKNQSLEEIFSSPEYLSFILAHKSNNLDAYPVCQNCEKNDYT